MYLGEYLALISQGKRNLPTHLHLHYRSISRCRDLTKGGPTPNLDKFAPPPNYTIEQIEVSRFDPHTPLLYRTQIEVSRFDKGGTDPKSRQVRPLYALP